MREKKRVGVQTRSDDDTNMKPETCLNERRHWGHGDNSYLSSRYAGQVFRPDVANVLQ